MQTLFNKKKKLIKQNNTIFNVFFINIFIITILTFYTIEVNNITFLIIKLFPFLNVEMVLGIILGLISSNIFIIRRIDINNKNIKLIEKEIERIKVNKQNNVDNLKKVKEIIINDESIQCSNDISINKNTTKKLVKKRF